MTAAVITGVGAVSAVGRGAARIWSAMAEGRDGIAPIARFDPGGFGVPLAGMVPDRNLPAYAQEVVPTWALCIELALDAAREALAMAGLGDGALRDGGASGIRPERVALILGSSLGDPGMPIHEMTRRVGDGLGIAGPRLTVSTACTSSTNALGMALDLFRLDAADVVLAGGTDVLTPLVLAGFTTLGVLSHEKCAPFSEPPGTTLGEGAGFLVLERRAGAARRGARAPLAVLGYGLSADGFHDTGPDPSGAGVARAIQGALDHAGVAPTDVDYVNAHGTGTRANDPAEWRALVNVFGAHAETLPVSASKSFLGHAQGAAGVVELIATLLAMEHHAVPPTMRFTVARPHSPRDPVGQSTARPARADVSVCTNSAFGGANCAVVVARADRDAPAAARRPVYVGGLGAVGPHGLHLDRSIGDPSTRREDEAGSRPSVGAGRVPPFALTDVLPSADPRGLDPSTRYLIAAVALALTDGGLRLRGADRDRTGLVVGITVASPEAELDLASTIERHGYAGLSASKFSRMVLNAPAGSCCKLVGLRGPHSTVAASDATGLFAILYAAELLASRRDADRLLAVGVDELLPEGAPPAFSSATWGAAATASYAARAAEASRPSRTATTAEGAACVLLDSAPSDILVAGWGLAGPGRLDDAIAAALAMAAPEAPPTGPTSDGSPRSPRARRAAASRGATLEADVDLIIDQASAGPGYAPALSVVRAALALRSGAARRVLVTQTGDGAADCALVLIRQESSHVP